jgi:hypothetical protein
MKVEHKGHTTIIRNTQGKTNVFFQKIESEYHNYKSQNLILDLSYDKELTMDDVKLFVDLIKSHVKAKKSIVLVSNSVNFNIVPKTITLVPTILEAHDIIEMEEIERDLGF